MALAGRADSVTITGDALSLKYTQGQSPLPGAWQGEALNFASKAEFVAAIGLLEAKFSGEDLALLQAAVAYKSDPSFGPVFVQRCLNRTCVLDLTGVAAPIVIG